MSASPAFSALREAFDLRFGQTAAAAFAPADPATTLILGIPEIDRALVGGFPRGAISTLEGPATAGRTAIAARALAVATSGRGAAALIEWTGDPGGVAYAPSLAAAGVDLDRLLIVRVGAAFDAIRAADIVLRSKAFGTIVVPALPPSRAVSSAAWTRIASLAHHAEAVVLAVGITASDELRYFASLRLECGIERVQWTGPCAGLFRELGGYDVRIDVRKHKRGTPVGSACVHCDAFERRAPLVCTITHQTATRENDATLRRRIGVR